MLKNRLKHHINCACCSANYLCLARNMQPEEIKALNAIITSVKVVKKGEHIFYAGDPMHHLHAVFTGCCKDYWVDEEGNQRIDNFYLPGDIIGLEGIPNRKHIFSAIALEDTQLCLIPLDALFELMQKHDFILKRIMNITSYKMQNDLHISMTTNASQRVADLILNIVYRLQERNKFDNCIILPMSQIDISLFLGMAHETVNRILRKMHKDKIIIISNKKISIIDFERLKELGSLNTYFSQV